MCIENASSARGKAKEDEFSFIIDDEMKSDPSDKSLTLVWALRIG